MNFESVLIESEEFKASSVSLEDNVLKLVSHYFRIWRVSTNINSIGRDFTSSGPLEEDFYLKEISNLCKSKNFNNQQIIKVYGKFLEAMKFNIDCELQKPINSEIEAYVKFVLVKGKTSFCASFFGYFNFTEFSFSEMVQIFYKAKYSGIENLFLNYYAGEISAPFLQPFFKEKFLSKRNPMFENIFKNIFKFNQELVFMDGLQEYYLFSPFVEDNFTFPEQTTFFLNKFKLRLREYFNKNDKPFININDIEF